MVLLPLWFWVFCRIEPGPGEMAVLIHKTGKDLPSGEILATKPDQKGIRLEVLPEGRYFRNPYSWGWQIKPITDIPAGKVCVQTRLYGQDLPPGKIIAEEGSKGIMAEVLCPGKYRINPYACQVVQETEKLKAEIKADQEKQVAETRALASKNVAEIEKDSAAIRAEKVRKLGEADAKVIQMVEGEKAGGQLMKVQAFGDAQAYSLWELASALTDDLKITILHAGPGTLWTDLEKAKLGELGGAKLLMEPAKSGR
ncbi:MAG: hypothetical protein ABIJ53_05605 [Verrucomicrobiota bacterium]